MRLSNGVLGNLFFAFGVKIEIFLLLILVI